MDPLALSEASALKPSGPLIPTIEALVEVSGVEF